MLITHSEDIRGKPIPQGLTDAMGKFVGEKMKSGEILDTAGLLPTSEASRVRLSKGKIKVTDGPFTEAKEVVGGYVMIEAKSKKDALALTTKFMDLHRVHFPEFEGACDVRPLERFDA
jgi:hypothetical protein